MSRLDDMSGGLCLCLNASICVRLYVDACMHAHMRICRCVLLCFRDSLVI